MAHSNGEIHAGVAQYPEKVRKDDLTLCPAPLRLWGYGGPPTGADGGVLTGVNRDSGRKKPGRTVARPDKCPRERCKL